MSKTHRPLYKIADDIRMMWRPRVHPYAAPYLNAMFSLHTIHDKYYADDGRSIVMYFLSNATTWKGEDAKRIKKELKDMLK